MRCRIGRLILGMAAIAAAAIPLASQTPLRQELAFEVVSIKLNRSGSDVGSINRSGGFRFIAINVPVFALLQFAYFPQDRVFDNQLIGGPDWIYKDRFDIQAKPPGDRPQLASMPAMVQALLEDRFQLKIHRDTRELPLYSLLVANNGIRLTLSEDQAPPELIGALAVFPSPYGVGPVQPETPLRGKRMAATLEALTFDWYGTLAHHRHKGRRILLRSLE